jgi:urea carboxylase-associated protein 2
MSSINPFDKTAAYHQQLAPDIAAEKVLWGDLIPGGAHCSYLIRKGTTLRFIDVQGGANVSLLMYRADDRLERLNLPDTLKAQHTAYLTQGHVLYSDMGRVLASVTRDTAGWHDPLCGTSSAESLAKKYGEQRYQEHRNAMVRNGRDSLIVELGKWGLGIRDLVPPLNLFSKIIVNADGKFTFVPPDYAPGAYLELRFEMDVLLALSAAPHPLDPSPRYQPPEVGLLAWKSAPVTADDQCRMSCPENQRGFLNTELFYR